MYGLHGFGEDSGYNYMGDGFRWEHDSEGSQDQYEDYEDSYGEGEHTSDLWLDDEEEHGWDQEEKSEHEVYTCEHDLDCGEETAEVGYAMYNCGEMPSLVKPGPILTCDDIKLGKDLTNGQRQDLRRILWKNEDAFAFTPEQLGRCTVAEFDVRLKEGARPVAQPYYRCPFKHREAFKAEIDKMVELGLMAPSNSPWSSPVVLVPKKDNTLRVTFDYRKGPNTWLEKDEYPLPRLDEILALLGGAKYFCAVDATKGFLQIPCTEEASRVLSVTTSFGGYSPLVMPMGVKTAPPAWQRVMNTGLSQHLGKRAFCYMDDCVVYATTSEEMLENVDMVLGSFRKMGIRLAPSKCLFGVTNLKFLGHIVTPEGIKPDEEILEAIEKYPVPTEKVHVQRMLGLTNWARKFVRTYSRIVAPLTGLTGNVDFAWGEKEHEAFEHLKQALKSPPILRQPDLSQPFILKTDAC